MNEKMMKMNGKKMTVIAFLGMAVIMSLVFSMMSISDWALNTTTITMGLLMLSLMGVAMYFFMSNQKEKDCC